MAAPHCSVKLSREVQVLLFVTNVAAASLLSCRRL